MLPAAVVVIGAWYVLPVWLLTGVDVCPAKNKTEAKLKDAVAAYHNSFAADQSMAPEVAEIEAEVEKAEAGA